MATHMCGIDRMKSMSICKEEGDERVMSEVMITIIAGGIALSAMIGVVYESFYADRE